MAVLKCKMCGGDISVADDAKVVACDYCGTTQTVPDVRDEIVLTLFNRANSLRLKCDFDKAEDIYRKIINEKPDESEGYWGLVLCKFGIEYVEDPTTFKRVPTCHRTSFEAVTADVDYLATLEHADSVARTNYEESAKEIDKIQKDILAVVKNEKPFDVFICYKETDESGKRTQDSAIANDIYHQLTQEGFKVFFAAITLEDKLGEKYEPYIFAALNSAKVMLVLGTRPEYFTAVWVKNEWSRFLKLMKTDSKKLLIPCFRDMDAYELPEEFSLLQAQDMSKIGFISDVVRGIKKVVTPETAPAPVHTPVHEPVAPSSSGNVDALLKRGFMALEDGEWNKADEFFEQVLNFDAELSEAYLGKLMAELRVNTEKELSEKSNPFDYSNNYKKAIRFGSPEVKKKLEGYIETINNRNLENAYIRARNAMNEATNEVAFKNVSALFDAISSYKDSAELAKTCLEYAEEARLESLYRHALNAMNGATLARELKNVADLFDKISSYKDSAEKAAQCREKAEEVRLDSLYTQALRDMKVAVSEAYYIKTAERFESISEYKDSAELAKQCRAKAEELVKAAEAAKVKKAEAVKKLKKISAIITIAIIAIIICAFVVINVIIPNMKYNEAVKLYESGKYDESIDAFNELGDYKDAKQQALNICMTNFNLTSSISAGTNFTAALKRDGSVIDTKLLIDEYVAQTINHNSNTTDCDVANSKGIIAISTGKNHIVCLNNDGTVFAIGSNADGQCNTSEWDDIVSISASAHHTVGLKNDGTVVAVGSNSHNKCSISKWRNIVAISSGNNLTVGICKDGKVVSTTTNPIIQKAISQWNNISEISAGANHIVALCADSTIIAAGDNYDGRCDVSEWQDVISISAGTYHTVALRIDGTVVATGNNTYGQCNVSDWTDIVAISAGDDHTVGLKSDGSVVAVGNNTSEQCNVSDWNLFE